MPAAFFLSHNNQTVAQKESSLESSQRSLQACYPENVCFKAIISFLFFSFYISNTNSSTLLYGQERDEAKRLYEF